MKAWIGNMEKKGFGKMWHINIRQLKRKHTLYKCTLK
jgi:hypothetical protein